MDNIETWEKSQTEKSHYRYTSVKLGRELCPRREKLLDFRKSKARGPYGKNENKWVKQHTIRKRRTFLKRNIYNEVYYRERERDFKTYGWGTW